MIQARAASTVKNMYRLSSLLPMYVDVCTRYMWYRCVVYTGYHLCAVCVCVLLYLPVSYRAHLRFLPCSLFSSTTVSAISCSTHTHNSHSQLTLTTSRMCTVPSVARSTPHTMNDECSTHMHNICTTISHLLHKLPLFWIPFCS